MSLKDAIREAVDERDKQVTDSDSTSTDSNAVNTASKQTAKIVNSKTVNTAKKSRSVAKVIPLGETAAMTVRVSRRHRLHWLIAAKQQGTSLTAAVTQALNERFGEPVD